MQRIWTLTACLFVMASLLAIPAKRGLWQTLTLADGTYVEAQLMGDEYLHYWQTADGRQLVERPSDGVAVASDMNSLQRQAKARRARADIRHRQHLRRAPLSEQHHYQGSKRGLVILVEFANLTFQEGHDSLLYTRICNEEGFTSNDGFIGSVHDYFLAQSYGEFDLTFDVHGPVTMPENYQYYGKDNKYGEDAHAGEMVALACQAVAEQVNFADYDWDGDGSMDQVMCIYAGRGQNDGGGSATIWPHEWELSESDYGQPLELQGITINTYAVTNERSASRIAGIGTICHEFSHCLGLPDMYDTNNTRCYGLASWSLMDQGSYNGNGFCPAAFTSYERYACGWVTPVVLDSIAVTIDAMQPLSKKSEVYMVRNDAHADEYYLLENRQKTGWDRKLPGKGLLVLHIDYDRDIWDSNIVNSIVEYNNPDSLPPNNHERCAIVRASKSWGIKSSANDAFPYRDNDSLTNTSVPAATLYHPAANGQHLLGKGIMDITQNADSTIAFRFRPTAEEPAETPDPEGIITVKTATPSDCHGTLITLTGLPATAPRKGLYIKDGRKVLVK